MNIILLSLTLLSLCIETAHAAQSYAGQPITVQKLTAQTSGLTQANVQSNFISKITPGNAAVVLISKSPKPVHITAYADSSSKTQFSFVGIETKNNVFTLQPDEIVKLILPQDFYLHVSSNKGSMEIRDVKAISEHLKSTSIDRNWIHPQKGMVYGIYANSKGLVPGLLKSPIDQKRTPTAWGKICATSIYMDSLRAPYGMNTLDEVMKFEQSKKSK